MQTFQCDVLFIPGLESDVTNDSEYFEEVNKIDGGRQRKTSRKVIWKCLREIVV